MSTHHKRNKHSLAAPKHRRGKNTMSSRPIGDGYREIYHIASDRRMALLRQIDGGWDIYSTVYGRPQERQYDTLHDAIRAAVEYIVAARDCQ